MIVALLIRSAMITMPPMKKVQKRTKEKYKIRQRAEKVRSMFSPQEKRSDCGKPEKH